MRLTNEELIQIIKEELEAVIDEKKGKKRKAAKKKRRKKKKKKKAKRDACYNKVKSRYDVWPSAYASGALVKCRKVGAANWGNSKKEGLDEEFKPHDMYDPETGEKHDAEVEADHVDMAGKGFVHVDPKKIEKILRDEGGAAGMDPFLKEFGKEMEEEILKALEEMPSVAQHEDGDYILDDDKEVDLQEVVPRTGIYAVKQSNIDFAKKIEARYREAGLTKKADLFKRAIDKAVAGEINLEQFHKMLDSAKTLQETKNCGCGQDPCKTYGKQ
jgi:hypothetical protein